MCGRITLAGTREQIIERFKVECPGIRPNYNGAPTQEFPVILNENQSLAVLARWGFLAPFSKDMKDGAKMINTRAEGIETKNSFKTAFASQRCLVVADSFYEWKNVGGRKTPYRITLADGGLFSFAGLWNRWDNAGKGSLTFSIITTTPNDQMKPVHDRMPVILPRESERRWLDRADPGLLAPYDGELKIYRVGAMVNSVKNTGPELVEEIR